MSGNTITVKASDGMTTQVQLASNGQILESTTAMTSDVKPGDFVVVAGSRQGNTVTATSINLASAPPTAG